MQFDSLAYLLLLLGTLIGFYGLGPRGRLGIVLVASAIDDLASDPRPVSYAAPVQVLQISPS